MYRQISNIIMAYQMETFSALLALSEGNHRSPVDSPHER